LASDIDFLTGHAGTGKTLQLHGSTRPLVAGPLGSPGSPGPLGFRAVFATVRADRSDRQATMEEARVRGQRFSSGHCQWQWQQSAGRKVR